MGGAAFLFPFRFVTAWSFACWWLVSQVRRWFESREFVFVENNSLYRFFVLLPVSVRVFCFFLLQLK